MIAPEETGSTFPSNALLKARHAAAATGAAGHRRRLGARGGRARRRARHLLGALRRRRARTMPRTTRSSSPRSRGCRRASGARAIAASLVYVDGPDDSSPLTAEGVWEGYDPRDAARRGRIRLRPVFLAARARDDRGGARSRREESAEPSRQGAAGAARAARGTRVTDARARSSLYVHMPWCVRKCPYCDFNSHQLNRQRPAAKLHRRVDSRLGGRTALDRRAARSKRCFSAAELRACSRPRNSRGCSRRLGRRARVAADAEVTLEANPGTMERGRFAGYRDAGINRVSLGAQSFRAAALARLGRIHSRRGHAPRGRGAARRGPREFQPGPDVRAARADARGGARGRTHRLRASSPRISPTISSRSSRGRCFTPVRRRCPTRMRRSRSSASASNYWPTSGFAQYEVSAYARAGARCRHNLNYWRSATTWVSARARTANSPCAAPRDIVRTRKAPPTARLSGAVRARRARLAGSDAARAQRSWVAASELPFEFMLNALRLNEGFAIRDFERRTGLERERLEPALAPRLAPGPGRDHRPAVGGPPSSVRRFLNDLQAGFLA